MTAWTNSSVLRFAGHEDPIAAMLRHAQRVVFEAIQSGWTGPPFDPLALADMLRIRVVPGADVKDARIVPGGAGGASFRIEFNPNRPRARVRYSIAHEIAHTFFPDCANRVRYRGSRSIATDEWQLETLCNIGAAELLMPVISLRDELQHQLGLEDVLQLSRTYDASVEAILIRICHLSQLPMIVFVASRQGAKGPRNYTIDYSIPSRSWRGLIAHGYQLPRDSAVSECTAIGFTSKGRERWEGVANPVEVEFVGLAPYIGSTQPRVAGIATPTDYELPPRATLEYFRGDALSPRGEGPMLIAHIVNDRTANWGGNGFAAAVKRKFPHVQQSFREWAQMEAIEYKLGRIQVAHIGDDVSFIQMIAQAGYGPSTRPRIRYQSLQRCLESVAELALSRQAPVHMPRIGMGHARGQWPVIEGILLESLVSRGVSVNVYDLPFRANSADEWKTQAALPLE